MSFLSGTSKAASWGHESWSPCRNDFEVMVSGLMVDYRLRLAARRSVHTLACCMCDVHRRHGECLGIPASLQIRDSSCCCSWAACTLG